MHAGSCSIASRGIHAPSAGAAYHKPFAGTPSRAENGPPDDSWTVLRDERDGTVILLVNLVAMPEDHDLQGATRY